MSAKLSAGIAVLSASLLLSSCAPDGGSTTNPGSGGARPTVRPVRPARPGRLEAAAPTGRRRQRRHAAAPPGPAAARRVVARQPAERPAAGAQALRALPVPLARPAPAARQAAGAAARRAPRGGRLHRRHRRRRGGKWRLQRRQRRLGDGRQRNRRQRHRRIAGLLRQGEHGRGLPAPPAPPAFSALPSDREPARPVPACQRHPHRDEGPSGDAGAPRSARMMQYWGSGPKGAPPSNLTATSRAASSRSSRRRAAPRSR